MNELLRVLEQQIGTGRIHTGALVRTAKAADAGCYRKIPRAVVTPFNEEEVIQTLKLLHRHGVALTFRAAGTSLSGQAVSDSVLLEARGDRWAHAEVREEGRIVRVEPGMTGKQVNQVLAPYGRKFGPDPASVNSAMVGGIIANNASGMSCGIHANAYATLRSARIILADGTLLDTADPDSRAEFARSHAPLLDGLTALRERILAAPALAGRIREKYKIKNTTGYSLNALTDFEDPVEILLHLLVGSEGTLGFVSRADFDTVPRLDHRASALLYFPGLKEACEAVPPLREARVPAIEIMDREALRSVENQEGVPAFLRDFGPGVCALLIDLEAADEPALEALIGTTREVLRDLPLLREADITRDPSAISKLWTVRKGVFPSVGGMRKDGTSVIIEDVAVPARHLTRAVLAMRTMLDELGYGDAVIYGHVLDGNLHFIFAQDFQNPQELEAYDRMIRRLTRLIVEEFDGSLKAEHGTGLNMAPFVALEWGPELYGVMREIKDLFDPAGILNPDVILSDDLELHLKNLKPMPLVDETVDRCIECGFCEINCPSEGFTLSARQRIVVQRELRYPAATSTGSTGQEGNLVREIRRDFRFAGEGSCAGDGLCALTCPLDIDTGVLIKKMRREQHARKAVPLAVARWTATRLRSVHALVGAGLGTLGVLRRLLGTGGLAALMKGLRFLSGGRLPAWDGHMPGRPRRQARRLMKDIGRTAAGTAPDRPTVVYFPSCINQSMGPSVKDPNQKTLVEVTREVLEAAGYRVVFPDRMRSLCCGTPWESKGFPELADQKSGELEEALAAASENGRHPILIDTSPCVHRMRRTLRSSLKVYEPVEFIHDFLLGPTLSPVPECMAFHLTCTSTKMGLEEKFRTVARACCADPVFPEEVGCCGFAGDKGFSLPDLNAHALRKLRPAVTGAASGYSNSRTCEIGLSRHSGLDYRSVMHLVHRCMGLSRQEVTGR
ncbi:MAG: FAD-binding and (Fe-S)-binding domain-containing protein [Bacteroidales bacterium]